MKQTGRKYLGMSFLGFDGSVGNKRKADASRLDEVDRNLHANFGGAANALSQLYSQTVTHQRLPFQSGERHALLDGMKAPQKVDCPKQSKLGVKKSTKKNTEKPGCTTANENFLVQKENSHFCQANHPLEAKFTVSNRKRNQVSVTSKFDSDVMVSSSMKIKLQLFPVDENTRIGLEKDGFCPYLELTVSPRKKISSVLKHIMTKWGRSSIAFGGEPKLLSCSDKVNLTSQKVWTLDDSITCAVDVFEALGRPSIFRLWYCWFPKGQPYPSASASVPTAGCSHHEAHDNPTDYFESTYVKEKETKTTDDVFRLTNTSENNLSGGSSYHMEKDVKADSDVDKNLLLWYDNCTNISIGGLFTEASLQGKFNTKSKPDACISKPKQGSSGLNYLTASNVPSSHHFPSSILDAEDTCSSFSFRKLFSSGNDAPTTDDIISTKSHTSSSAQVAAQHDRDCQEAKTDLILRTEVYNDDRSLGLRSIKWTDSLGPFDLFVPSSRNIRN